MTDTTPTPATTESAPATAEHTTADRRYWLKANGFIVGDRGRLSPAHHKAYDEAHGLA